MFGKYTTVKRGVTRGNCGPVDIWAVHMLSAVRLICGVDTFGAERRDMFKRILWDMLTAVLGQLGPPKGKTLFSPILTGGGLIIPDGLGNLFPGHTRAVIRIRRRKCGRGFTYRVFEDDTELTADKLVGITRMIFIDECSASGTSVRGALAYLISLGYRGEVWFACPIISNYAIRTWSKYLRKVGNPITLRVICAGVYGILREGGFGHGKRLTDFVVLTSQLPKGQTRSCFVPEEQSRAFYTKFQPKSVTTPAGIICPVGDATDSLGDDREKWLKQLRWLFNVLRERSNNRELVERVGNEAYNLEHDVASQSATATL